MEPPPSPMLELDLPTAVLVALLAYVIGSFPTGAIIARLYGKIDLTRTGSARTGATNALRTMGLGAGIIVLFGDFAKGMIAVALARHLSSDPLALGLAAFFAVVGHNHSIFLRGRGGRGVVTGLGGLSVVSPVIFLLAVFTGSVVAGTTRYVSLGSICGAAVAMVAAVIAVLTGNLPFVVAVYILITSGLIIGSHSDNIARLRAGTERRLGRGDEAAPGATPTS